MLVKMIENAKVSACGRDNAMELIIKYVTRETGLHWTRKFLDSDGGFYVVYFLVFDNRKIMFSSSDMIIHLSY